MRTINLKCDRCKREETVEYEKQSKLALMRVGVAVCDNPYSYAMPLGAMPLASVKNSQEWCERCRAEVGLVYSTEAAKAGKPAPTLEEQLLEVLRNFVRAEVQQ